MSSIVIVISTTVITILICGKINENTIGTTRAYIVRGIVVWGVTFFLLLGIWGKITGQI